MSDYTRANSGGATHFGDKDALTTGDADKVIVGSQFDSEFQAILTACNSKYDSADLSSQAEAEALTLDTKIITPHSLNDVLVDNGGMLGDIQALADPGFDTLLGWDDTGSAAIGFTLGNGITSSGTAIVAVEGDLDITALSGYAADANVLHANVTMTAGSGMTGGGTLEATRTLNVIGGDGITANANDIALTAQSASATVPISIASGVLGWDASSITEIVAQGVDQAADGYFVSNAGVLNIVPYDQNGIIVTTGSAAKTFAITDANTMAILTGTTERVWTIPANAAVAFELGTIIICKNNSTTQDIVITADTGVALVSKFHLSGTAASDNIVPGGAAVLIKMATDQWSLAGDIETS